MKYEVRWDERMTLYLTDYEPDYMYADEVDEIPDALVAWWNRASEDLQEAEIAIREHLKNEQSSTN